MRSSRNEVKQRSRNARGNSGPIPKGAPVKSDRGNCPSRKCQDRGRCWPQLHVPGGGGGKAPLRNKRS